MIIRVIDFETTDLPPDASVCEIGFVDVFDKAVAGWGQSLVFPRTEMSLKARATHHITDEEINGSGMSWEGAREMLTVPIGPCVYAAHNADFEKAFFNPLGSRWIDTYKVALRLWPDAPSHSNQVLRYYLNLDVGGQAMPPHRALPDAWVTAHILLAVDESDASVEQMITWSDEPAYLTKVPFGKHFGEKFSDVPTDYLRWVVKQDMDEAVLAAAHRELVNVDT